MKTRCSHSERDCSGVAGGFTLIELLVVIAIIAILASLLLPVLAKARDQSWQTKCLDNMKQMQLAWKMYADDSKDIMCPNAPEGEVTDNKVFLNGSHVVGWGALDGNTNTFYLTDGLLSPYILKGVGIYECPGDTIPSDNGQRVRSVGMNGCMGCCYEIPGGAGTAFYSYPYLPFIKMSDLMCPSPSMAIVFADESMFTLDDAWMQPSRGPDSPEFPNAPARYHCGGCCFSFADGHAEPHAWRGPVLRKLPYSHGVTSGGGYNPTTATDPDFIWIAPRWGCVAGQLSGVAK